MFNLHIHSTCLSPCFHACGRNTSTFSSSPTNLPDSESFQLFFSFLRSALFYPWLTFYLFPDPYPYFNHLSLSFLFSLPILFN